MIIDCDSCQVRGLACGDCVVAVLIGPPGSALSQAEPGPTLDADERRALAVLADAGLVPPLRLAGDQPSRRRPPATPVTNDTDPSGRRAV